MRAAHGVCGYRGYFVEIWATRAGPAVGWADGCDDGIALGMPEAHMAEGHGIFDIGALLWGGGAPMREDDYRPRACARIGAGERGLNENTNGLLRQYFPKGTDLHNITPVQVQDAAHALNHRPRKCLGYKTPHEVFYGLKLTPIKLPTDALRT